MPTIGCQRCQEAEQAIGQAEVRVATAEAKLRRERKWWSGWMIATAILLGYTIYLKQADDLKHWLWYDFIFPARQATQSTPREPYQQVLPQQYPPTGRAPNVQNRSQPTPSAQRRMR